MSMCGICMCGMYTWSVQSPSHVQIITAPWTAAHQASLSITNSRSSLRLMSIESVMPSSHLILCRPLLLPPSIVPSIRVFSNESVLRIRWPKYWSFSFSIMVVCVCLCGVYMWCVCMCVVWCVYKWLCVYLVVCIHGVVCMCVEHMVRVWCGMCMCVVCIDGMVWVCGCVVCVCLS